MVIRATIKGGVAVPESNFDLPEGTEVGIIVPEKRDGSVAGISPEFKDEFQYWENLSADAWERFLEWEATALCPARSLELIEICGIESILG